MTGPNSDPAASDPAASDPAASEPAASEPAASEPAASEPAASEPAAAPPSPQPKAATGAAGQGSVSFWWVAVIFGLVFALYGVSAASGSIQRKDYAQARQTWSYILSNGNKISGSIDHLHTVNARDYDLVKAAKAALDDGDTARFNRVVAQAEVFSPERLRLQQQVKDYKAAFDLANQR